MPSKLINHALQFYHLFRCCHATTSTNLESCTATNKIIPPVLLLHEAKRHRSSNWYNVKNGYLSGQIWLTDM